MDKSIIDRMTQMAGESRRSPVRTLLTGTAAVDGSTFDRLDQVIGPGSSRCSLLGVLTWLGLGGVLSVLQDDTVEARGKRHGRRRSHRPGKKKDNRKGKRTGNGSDLGGRPCVPINVAGN